MKKIILSIAVVASAFAFAQKKEIASAFKAINGGDVQKATSDINAADAALSGKIYTLDPELQEQYYYAKGLALLKSGKTDEGASVLAKIFDLKEIYSGKDASRTKVYFAGKEAADASKIADLKKEMYALKTIDGLGKALNPMIQKVNTEAVDAYNSKNYAVSAPKFIELYQLLKAAGNDDKRYMYNAAIAYLLADNKAAATPIFVDLVNSGYTGVETTYTAVNKKSGQTEALDKNSWEFMKKLGDAGEYKDFKSETSPSIEEELYERSAALLLDQGKADEALAIIEKGIKKFPNNTKLTDFKGTAFYKSGKTDQFINNLKEQVAKDPKNKEAWFNLGVLQSKDPATVEDGITSYKKVIEIDPNFKNAYINLVYTIMGDDAKAVDDYNALRKAGKIDQANKVIDARRQRFEKALPYAEKWYSIDPNDIDVVSLLRGFYTSTKNTAKAAEFKALEEKMSAKK